jgi:hypothetical protein
MGSLSTSRARHKRAISADPQAVSDELLVGVGPIARELGQSERRTYHWLKKGVIKSVQQRGRLYTAGRRALRREFGLVD